MIFNRYVNASATSKNSRIDSLCQNLGVSERRFSGDILEIQKDINYAEVKNNLNNLQQKTIEWSSVLLALRNMKKVGEVVDHPKALGDIRGVTYIYGIFYRFGLIDVPDEVKEKMGHPKKRKK